MTASLAKIKCAAPICGHLNEEHGGDGVCYGVNVIHSVPIRTGNCMCKRFRLPQVPKEPEPPKDAEPEQAP